METKQPGLSYETSTGQEPCAEFREDVFGSRENPFPIILRLSVEDSIFLLDTVNQWLLTTAPDDDVDRMASLIASASQLANQLRRGQ